MLRLVTAPSLEPLTLVEAKAHLRVDTEDDDTEIAALVTAAREHIEMLTGRALVSQVWELVLREFPAEQDDIVLPRGALSGVTHAKYYDGDGVLQTLTVTTDYVVDTGPPLGPGRVILAYGKSWPSTRDQWDAVQVRYTVGWSQAEVPEALKSACKLALGELYEHRTQATTGTIVADLPAFRALLGPYRVYEEHRA